MSPPTTIFAPRTSAARMRRQTPTPRASEATLRTEILDDRLSTPLTANEASQILEVSRPTILKWVDAGLLPEADGSRPTKRLLDVLSVYRVRQVLSKVREDSPRREGGEWFRRLIEELFWAAHPEEQASLNRSIDQANAGQTVPLEDDVIEAARRRRREAASASRLRSRNR